MSLNWATVQRLYATDSGEHLNRAEALELACPQDTFEQLFHDHHDDPELAVVLRFVDWSQVTWEEGALSGVALRHIGIPRPFRHAVDEARQRTALSGLLDERAEVAQHWNECRTWIRPPIVLAGELLNSSVRHELVVGFTRLGNLLGALDRQDLPEHVRHRVWIGRNHQATHLIPCKSGRGSIGVTRPATEAAPEGRFSFVAASSLTAGCAAYSLATQKRHHPILPGDSRDDARAEE